MGRSLTVQTVKSGAELPTETVSGLKSRGGGNRVRVTETFSDYIAATRSDIKC